MNTDKLGVETDLEYSLGLIGYPLHKSLSPRLHNAALARLGLRGEFRLYPTPPMPEGAGQLEGTLARVRSGEIQGLNVTIPHKQSVLAYLDRLTPIAQAIGAVNTIFCQDGALVGDNTDAPGFITDLKLKLAQAGMLAHVDGETGRKALVLGAGGAARAVVYTLWQEGWQVRVAARRKEQAAQLVASLLRQSGGTSDTSGSLEALALDADRLKGYLSPPKEKQPQVIVNASSAGMLPDIGSCAWPEELPLPPGVFVYDVVYKPLQTRLLSRAREAGLPAANGLGMLVEQAALAFERWTGLPAPRQAIEQALEGGAG
jgi:shikimate dehydrogenase